MADKFTPPFGGGGVSGGKFYDQAGIFDYIAPKSGMYYVCIQSRGGDGQGGGVFAGGGNGGFGGGNGDGMFFLPKNTRVRVEIGGTNGSATGFGTIIRYSSNVGQPAFGATPDRSGGAVGAGGLGIGDSGGIGLSSAYRINLLTGGGAAGAGGPGGGGGGGGGGSTWGTGGAGGIAGGSFGSNGGNGVGYGAGGGGGGSGGTTGGAGGQGATGFVYVQPI